MEAALALRRRDASARITLVSDEHDHFYSRPALMYVFAGQLDLRDTEPYDRGLYERMRFERVRGRVASLDPEARALRFEDGRVLGYDRLLLAAGSRARDAPWPGSEGPGRPHFVTLRDLEALDRDAEPGRRAVVIGGGLIGVEVAEILHDRGLSRRVRDPRELVLPAGARPQEAALVAEHMRAHGIDVRLGANVEEIARDAQGGVPERCVLEGGGEIPCDLVVVCHRRRAQHGLPRRRRAPASSKGGAIEVDDALRASVPDVWAAGDCANVTWADGSPPPRAALVHRARPGPRGRRAIDARRRGHLSPRHLVQLREVLRPGVDDRGLGARPA